MHLADRLFLAGLLSTPALAAASAPDVFELGLEQLTQLQVNVASGKTDSIVDAPAIVSSYSRADLEKFGIRTLKDMLSFIPGFVRQETYLGTTAIGVRGISDGFNQKLLLPRNLRHLWNGFHLPSAACSMKKVILRTNRSRSPSTKQSIAVWSTSRRKSSKTSDRCLPGPPKGVVREHSSTWTGIS